MHEPRFAALALAGALAVLSAPATSRAAPAPSAAPSATPIASTDAATYVRGQALAYRDGYFVFTTGDALRLRDGTLLPTGLSIGSVVRVRVDPVRHDVTAIELDPQQKRPGEIDIATLPRAFVVVTEKSAPLPARAGATAGSASSGLVNVTIDLRVPANTPTTDDVYLSTDRSNYSPAEIRMQRVDARRFTVSIGLAANTIVKYQFTRGTYTTVERDRTGGIVPPHQLPVAPGAKADDTVARWADIS